MNSHIYEYVNAYWFMHTYVNLCIDAFQLTCWYLIHRIASAAHTAHDSHDSHDSFDPLEISIFSYHVRICTWLICVSVTDVYLINLLHRLHTRAMSVTYLVSLYVPYMTNSAVHVNTIHLLNATTYWYDTKAHDTEAEDTEAHEPFYMWHCFCTWRDSFIWHGGRR